MTPASRYELRGGEAYDKQTRLAALVDDEA